MEGQEKSECTELSDLCAHGGTGSVGVYGTITLMCSWRIRKCRSVRNHNIDVLMEDQEVSECMEPSHLCTHGDSPGSIRVYGTITLILTRRTWASSHTIAKISHLLGVTVGEKVPESSTSERVVLQAVIKLAVLHEGENQSDVYVSAQEVESRATVVIRKNLTGY
ncbi:hypothetical protein PoB_001105300 [Plakobranchus ocellatus]|uniref:Uncharacterized protein n=1 Tax=Plakobranchus ocellatus TaxID=259542 RepID=A0AAV3YQL9_9GAST|nr:hypothetical protein PoB_001105300 [Plakobranchus ocellatus]